MEQLRLDLENNDMPIDQRLEDLGIDPVEYKMYVHTPSPMRV
jgi:small subunit ribosomal protein S10